MKLDNTKQFLENAKSEKVFGDYVLVVRRGAERAALFSDGCGMETLFDIASMGKVLVTAPLILKAVGEGLLSLDDTLPRFFANVPQEKQAVTVRQLLTHTSGIVRIPLPLSVTEQGRDAVAALILSAPLAFAPGTSNVYSCNGFILLGYIAELLYGAPLDRLFETMLKPALGLNRSCFDLAVDAPDAVVCYRRSDAGVCRCDDENVYNMRGVAGSGASFWNAADIERYVEAVMGKSPALYAPELYGLAERDYTPSFGEGRGLGWVMVDARMRQTGKLFPQGSFGHCGHTGTSFFMNRETGLSVILLTNATRFANMKNNFRGYDYETVKRLREEIHNRILSDIG